MIAKPLRVVARRCGNNAALQHLWRQLQQRVQRAAFFLGRRELQVFKLQIDVCPRQLRQGLAVQRGRCDYRVANAVMRCADIVKGQEFAGGLIGHRQKPLTHLAQ